MTYFIAPTEAHLILSNISDVFTNISDLFTNTTINQASSDLNRTLTNTSQAINIQVSNPVTPEPASHDIFYGVSRAAPGTFEIIVRR